MYRGFEIIIGVILLAALIIYMHNAPSSENIASVQDILVNDPHSPSIGNPYGPHVTIVDFSDYQCGPCKNLSRTLEQLAEEDTHVRIVFKECPRLGPTSVLEAKAALAVNSIDETKYIAFHNALMASSGELNINALASKAEETGVNPDLFRKAMESPDLQKELNSNYWLADKLNSTAVPLVIVGDEVATGDYDLESLKAMVAKTRETSAKK